MKEEMRLQVYMAKCGVASRRASEELILAGKVKVNGKVVTELGTKVTKDDDVYVNGVLLNFEEKVYYVLNKPSGYITTVSDDKGRKTILDLFLEEHLNKRIFPVGRLDYDTEGVIIVTNDGELSNRLTSPKSNVEKEYQARVIGKIDNKSMSKINHGVVIDGYKTKPARIFLVSYDKESDTSLVNLTITEGKNHQVKKMLEAVGYPVKHLTRLRFAFLTTEGIGKGYYRELKVHEVKQLYNL